MFLPPFRLPDKSCHPHRYRNKHGDAVMRERSFERILLFLSVLLLIVSVYAVASTYQKSRYHAGTPGYRPWWDGSRWVSEPGKFTCVDFTNEAIGFFDVIGVRSYQVVGNDRDTGIGHSWVGIDFFGCIINFEPQTLTVFDPSGGYTGVTVNYGSWEG